MKSFKHSLAVIATVLLFVECIRSMEMCPQENCLTADKCEEEVKSQVMCQQQGTTCCSIVKDEYRTHCRHHGGMCMDKCAAALQHQTVDCVNDQVCCVLV